VPKKITHSRVLKIAIPIVLSNATIPILGAVDTGVIGQLGNPAAIGAVGIGAIIITAIYWIFGFLRMGTVGLTSQAYGAGEHSEVNAMLSRSLFIGFIAGIVLILLQAPLFWASFQISPASAEVESMASRYMSIRVFSAPAAISLFGITGWLIALEKTKAVLLIQIAMNGLNIILDFLFVLHWEFGIEGVAYATFIAEWSGLAIGLFLCQKISPLSGWFDRSLIFDRSRLKKMASVNSDILIRSVLLEAAFVSFLFIGSDFGDVTLAANQILLQFLSISAFALDGFAFSAESLVGQAFGARNRERFRRAALLTSLWGAVMVLIWIVILFSFGNSFVNLMTTSELVREEANSYLKYLLILPVIGIFAWMLDGIFIGATRTRDMRNMMAISFVAYVIFLSVLVPAFGNDGLWIGLIVLFIFRTITLGIKYPALERTISNI
jgi:MATE family multidrug resistance protein